MYNTFPVSFSLDKESLAKLERLSAERQTSRSQVIRDLIAAASNGDRKLVDSREPYTVQEAT